MFIEYKTARRLHRASPPRNPADWANEAIYKATVARLQALLNDATGTRVTQRGSTESPPLAEIKGFRHLQFRIDADSPGLRAGVEVALRALRANYSGWTFEVRWGLDLQLPPLPDWATPGQPQENP
jgi:hypothetical protein